MNLFRRETEGWDFALHISHKTQLGDFELSAGQSGIIHLREQFDRSLPERELAGMHPNSGGAPKFRRTGTLTWNRGDWGAGWSSSYVSSYEQVSFLVAGQGSAFVDSQLYHDAYVSYTVASGRHRSRFKRASEGLTIQLGVRNIFDDVPPLDVSYSSNHYLSPYGDIRLRSYWINVKKSF